MTQEHTKSILICQTISVAMLITKNQETLLYKFKNLSRSERILHFVSTRLGGVSKSPYKELNLGLHVGDVSASVLSNRMLLMKSVGIHLNHVVTCNQTHGGNVTIVDSSMKGMGAYTYDSALPDTDALITNQKNICLMVMVADCVPIILFDPEKSVIGVVHAGWKGTVLNVTSNTIKKMSQIYNSTPQNIIAGIGPSIGPAKYEVGPEVVETANSNFLKTNIIRTNKDGKTFFDLWKANLHQLLESGLSRKNIELAGICTFTNNDIFYSHRREKNTGRFCAAISLLN